MAKSWYLKIRKWDIHRASDSRNWMNLLITVSQHSSKISRGNYLSLTFCCDFGHVWLSQSLLVESSVSAFMYQLLSLLDSLALFTPLFSSVYHLMKSLTHFKVSLKPLDTVKVLLRSGVCIFSPFFYLFICGVSLLGFHSDCLSQALLCCLCGLVPVCIMQLLVVAVLSVPLYLYFRALRASPAIGAANPSWYVTIGCLHVSYFL